VRVTVRLFAGLRERAGREELVLDAPEVRDIAGAKRWLERQHPELGSLAGVRGVLGTSYVPDEAALVEGGELSLLPPVSGGSGADEDLAAGVFELSREPLDAARALARVEHPSCGAVVLFSGNARERNHEREVVRLDYEAFAAMAESEMRVLFARCLAEVARGEPARALRMLVQHRTGTVAIGAPAVLVCVASPHRDAAFVAARFLIDELKANVPLWKKEVYSDGHEWLGDRP
jgi:molybdopterin synthase catalytic subunit